MAMPTAAAHALSALGITIAGPVQRVSGAEAASRVPDAPVQDEGPLPEGTQMVDGLALPGPVASAPVPFVPPSSEGRPSFQRTRQAFGMGRQGFLRRLGYGHFLERVQAVAQRSFAGSTADDTGSTGTPCRDNSEGDCQWGEWRR